MTNSAEQNLKPIGLEIHERSQRKMREILKSVLKKSRLSGKVVCIVVDEVTLNIVFSAGEVQNADFPSGTKTQVFHYLTMNEILGHICEKFPGHIFICDYAFYWRLKKEDPKQIFKGEKTDFKVLLPNDQKITFHY